MRGDDQISGSLFSYLDLEERVRADHPLRAIREIANAVLVALSRDFATLHSGMGRPSCWAMADRRNGQWEDIDLLGRLERSAV